MWIRICDELFVMSAVAGGLYLVFKLPGRWTGKHLAARWHYGMMLMVCSFFLIPYHRLLPPVDLGRAAGNTGSAEGAPAIEPFRSAIDLSAEQFLQTDALPLSLHKETVFPWRDILPWLLPAGTLVFIGVVIVQYCRLHLRIARTCLPAGQPELLDVLEACKRQLGIRRNIVVYLSPHVTTPFLYGWIRPRIVLPDIPFAAGDCRHVFLHELTHYKRRDPWIKLALLIINAIHWFNPFTYMARRDADRFCEFTCDETVVKPMDAHERRRYCALILRVLLEAADQRARVYSAFGGRKKDLERRIMMILNSEANRKKKWVRMLSIGMALMMVLFGIAAAYAASDNGVGGTAAGGTEVAVERIDSPELVLEGEGQWRKSGTGETLDQIVTDGIGQLTKSASGEWNLPVADGIDEGQFEIQPLASSYNYSSSSFKVGVYLNSGKLFNIQNTPKFTNVKQSTVSDGSCNVAYQIINASTGQITAKSLSGAYVNTSTTVEGFNTSIATGDCQVYLAGQDPTVEKKASGTFNY